MGMCVLITFGVQTIGLSLERKSIAAYKQLIKAKHFQKRSLKTNLE